MLRTIIIDDELQIRLHMESLVRKLYPRVKIMAVADGVKSGLKAIHRYKPDLVLLDIEMNDGTGFHLLDQLQPIDFKVVFITAYDQYAIKAFKCSAIDYLLKPIDPDELTEAIDKAEKLLQQDFNTQLNALRENISTADKANKKIILRTSDNIYLVKVQEINYCRSEGSYTDIFLLNGKKITVSNSLGDYEDILAENGFYRVHKSYLINMRQIERFEKAEGGNVILINESKIPVSSRKREELLDMFERLAEPGS